VTRLPPTLLPALGLVFNALVWGVSWWPFRYLQSHGLHPLWATAFMYTLAVLCVLVVRPQAWRAMGHTPLLWALMLASGLTNASFNWAVTVGDVVRVVLLFYLMPAWVVLLAWPMLGEKPKPVALARMAMALTGLFVMVKQPDQAWPIPSGLADWLAIAGGFSFALINILLHKLGNVPAQARMFAMFLGGGLTAGGAAVVAMGLGLMGGVPAFSADWLGVALLLSLAFLASNAALQYGVPLLSAHTAALLMLSEVLFAAVSSALLGAALFTDRVWLGGTLIVLAAVWSAWPTRDSTRATH
jgi:drug/metabolite transporter (DMT)-like permease